jgi:hypothetical protein
MKFAVEGGRRAMLNLERSPGKGVSLLEVTADGHVKIRTFLLAGFGNYALAGKFFRKESVSINGTKN